MPASVMQKRLNIVLFKEDCVHKVFFHTISKFIIGKDFFNHTDNFCKSILSSLWLNLLFFICSVFKKHETSQIREEETFSSKRCLEWFYEYAGEIICLKATQP